MLIISNIDPPKLLRHIALKHMNTPKSEERGRLWLWIPNAPDEQLAPCTAASAISVWTCVWMDEWDKCCKAFRAVSRVEKHKSNANPYTVHSWRTTSALWIRDHPRSTWTHTWHWTQSTSWGWWGKKKEGLQLIGILTWFVQTFERCC